MAASAIPIISAVGPRNRYDADRLCRRHARAHADGGGRGGGAGARAELIGYVEDLGTRQRQAARRLAGNNRDRLRAAAAGLPRPSDLVSTQRQRLDHAASNLLSCLRHSVQAQRVHFSRVAPRLGPQVLRQRQDDLAERLRNFSLRAETGLRKTVDRARLTYDPRAERLATAARLLVERKQGQLAAIGPKLSPSALRAELRHSQSQLAPLAGRLVSGFGRGLTTRRAALDQASKLLSSVGYESVLARGFAIVTDGEGQLVRSKQGLQNGDPLNIRFAGDEIVPVVVTGAAPVTKKKPRAQTDGDTQESLF